MSIPLYIIQQQTAPVSLPLPGLFPRKEPDGYITSRGFVEMKKRKLAWMKPGLKNISESKTWEMVKLLKTDMVSSIYQQQKIRRGIPGVFISRIAADMLLRR